MEVTPVALIGLICAAGGIELVPARAWPVEAAIEQLRTSAPAGRVVRRAAQRWSGTRCEGYGVAGVAAALRQLVAAGRAVPEGTGWDAGWRLRPEWLSAHEVLLSGLDTSERAAVLAAGQLAAEMSSRWSKKAVAAVPTS